ncbi:alpha/beta fold hydrolase [Flammeovirga pectinis]|uniref:Alpha/beta fold hydrolase n=1 Tax=Flammeovirga pectinis TaxID=2494373 RepID=A0A3Q9FR82_9BACT|nr:alpha/beta fold hydrolase [Flammeovirga pectinis]AZQ62865.1 alpha/beta fold hydrolase [Flammeovirga pectinis]
MPVVNSMYLPDLIFRNGHINTIAANRFQKKKTPIFNRRRYFTLDKDFFDVDTILNNHKMAIILLHGLEGSSSSPYILEMSDYFSSYYDIWAINHRSCSGEPNTKYYSYHSGKTDDLDLLVNEIADEYDKIMIIGFSLGGNITLKYLGEKAQKINQKVIGAVAISVPCDLNTSAKTLQLRSNWLYLNNFLRSLKLKAIQKLETFDPSSEKITKIAAAKTFVAFDDEYTAPAHGFRDAEDYWTKCSSKQFLRGIIKPTLIINALDDPFLSKECYPYYEAEQNKNVFLETPKYGGHVGFLISLNKQRWYLERVLNFIQLITNKENFS